MKMNRELCIMYEPERPIEPPEPKPVMMCDICSGELYDDEDYYELDGSCMCERCAQLWLLDRKRVV